MPYCLCGALKLSCFEGSTLFRKTRASSKVNGHTVCAAFLTFEITLDYYVQIYGGAFKSHQNTKT